MKRLADDGVQIAFQRSVGGQNLLFKATADVIGGDHFASCQNACVLDHVFQLGHVGDPRRFDQLLFNALVHASDVLVELVIETFDEVIHQFGNIFAAGSERWEMN